ncbi:MAG: DNA-processing protein DprA [Thermoanaerobaculia bacterium]
MTDTTVRIARDQLIGWSLLTFLTPTRLRLLYERFDPLAEVCKSASTEISMLLNVTGVEAALVKDPLQLPEFRKRIEQLRESTLTLADEIYPSLLRETPDPPPALHFRGDPSILRLPAIAMVGSRRASPYGINVVRRLARDLARAGIVVVSGLATGIDAAAHEAALDAGGTTAAVLGTGIDVCYPRSNRRLYDRIAAEGLVLTELPASTPPHPRNFPVRNRIIAGMSRGTIVVEAGLKSGSLITARIALDEGREVFAVPGPIFSAGSAGTHRLIQSGAKLVHEMADVFDEFADLTPPGSGPSTLKLAPSEREIVPLLSMVDPIHVDRIAAVYRRSTSELAEALLNLEMKGVVRALPGNHYVLRSD